MLDYIKDRLKEVSSWQGIVAIIAAIVMYFTPDEIDRIIVMVLSYFGITQIFKVEKQ